MAFHRARRICKQASFRLVHMHETPRAHVEYCYKEKPQTERSLFTNSSSSMEGHINKVIFTTCHSKHVSVHVLGITLLIWPSIVLEVFVNRLLSVCGFIL